MSILFKGELIPRDQITEFVKNLETFSPAKNAVKSKFEDDNRVAKIDRVTAQIHLFRTVKREGLDRLCPHVRKGRAGNDLFVYKSSSIVDAYDLKILLAICAVGSPDFANYLHLGDAVGWRGLSCVIKIVDILEFIGRRNDPDNRKRVLASLARLSLITVEIYRPKIPEFGSSKFDIHEIASGSLIKIFEKYEDTWINVGLFYTLAKEAWIPDDNPKYAPISKEEIQILSKNDIAIILFVFLRSDLGAGSGAKYRYDDMVRLVRGEDREKVRAYPKQAVINSRNNHHAGADRQSISHIKLALKLIDEKTEMRIYKHRDPSKFVAIRPL